jgi:two-component system sensor histidine kinase EvgS/two-component system sensor histidine kinase/response regulator
MVPMLRAWPGLPVLAFAFLLLLLAADVASGAQPRTVLTPEQSAWVAGHGKVRLGIARTDWPPFDLVDYAGRHTGITADYLELVQARTGLDIRPVLFGDWNQVLRALRAGQVDLVGSMAPTRERQTYLAFTEPYVSNPSIIVARKDRPEITGLESLRGKSVATEAGYATHELLRAQYPDIRLDVVKSTLDALMEVSLGKADGYVGDLIVSSWLIDRNSIANLEVRSQAHMTTGELAFAVRKNLPELADVVNAALASITDAEHRAIRQRWVPLGRTDAKKPATIELTPAERAWIAAHPKIRVGVNPAFEPL